MRGPVTTRRFWEKVAGGYPLPFEARSLERASGVMGIMEKSGITIQGSLLLDIGSGTGAFALPLALRGARVTALDISPAMLRRLEEEADRKGVRGVRTYEACWKELDVQESGLEKAFDIALCGLSSAIETRNDIEKMEHCSRQWCVYAASGKIVRDSRFTRVLGELRAPLTPRPDVRVIARRLSAIGRRPLFESFPVATSVDATVDKLIDLLKGRLEAAGRRVGHRKIASAVATIWGGQDTIRCQGEVEVGVLMWRVDEGKR